MTLRNNHKIGDKRQEHVDNHNIIEPFVRDFVHDLASHGALGLASTAEVEAQVTAAVAALVDASPATLDTLNELAAALGDDPNFATTITALIASKATPADITAAIVALDLGPASTMAVGTTAGTVAAGDDTRLADERVPTDGSVVDAKVAVGAAIAEAKLALASDAAVNVASRRTLGTGATQAAAGDDTRLSDARTPTAHRATHGLGGTDALTTADLASGTPDSTTFLRGDRTWAAVAGGVTSVNTRTGDVAGLAEDNTVVHLSGAELITGLKTIQSSAAGAVGLIVKGVAAQTADLQQWQDSAGAVVLAVTSTGKLTSSTSVVSASLCYFKATYDVIARDGTGVGEVTIGSIGPQSLPGVSLGANNSTYPAVIAGNGTPEGAVAMPVGSVFIRKDGGTETLFYGKQTGTGNTGWTALGSSMKATTASTVGLVVQGAAAQTVDLQQWQNSAAAVLVRVDSAGRLAFGSTGQERIYRKAAGQIGFSVRTDGSENGYLQEGGQGAGAGLSFISNSHAAFSTPSGYSLYLNNLYISGNQAAMAVVRVLGAASQTADLQQWLDSASSIKAQVQSTGKIRALHEGLLVARSDQGANLGGASLFCTLSYSSAGQVSVVTQAGVALPWAARQIRSVDQGGLVGIDFDSVAVHIRNNSATLPVATFSQNNPDKSRFTVNAVADIPVGVRGMVGQTGDLQQWQDSAGSVLARLTAGGVFSTNGEHYTSILSFTTNSAGAPTTGKTWHVTPSSSDLVFVRSGIAENIKMLSAGDMEFMLISKGPILRSPNGTRYRITVADDGALSAVAA